MRFGSRRIMCGAAATAGVWLLSVALVGGQAPTAAQNQMLAENVFKNITVLRGIPVDEFMGTMGVFSAALGLSCEDLAHRRRRTTGPTTHRTSARKKPWRARWCA